MALSQPYANKSLHSIAPASKGFEPSAGLPRPGVPTQAARHAEKQSIRFVHASTIKSLGLEKRKHLRQHLVKNHMRNKIHGPLILPDKRTRPLVWRYKAAPNQTPYAEPAQNRPSTSNLLNTEVNLSRVQSDVLQEYRQNGAANRSQRADTEPKQTELLQALLHTLPLGANPRTFFLGSGRVDPFGVYSFDFGSFEHQILDFHYNTLPEVMFGFKPQAPLCYLRISVDQAIQDQSILHLVLSFAMYRWSALKGRDDQIEHQAFKHKMKGLEIVNQRLGDMERRVDDFNIQSAIIMTGIEGRTGNVESFKTHNKGLRSMVAERGGLTAVNRVLAWQLCSAELRLLEKVGVEHMPCRDDQLWSFVEARQLPLIRHMAGPGSVIDPMDLPPSLYLSTCVEEFFQSLFNFQSLSRARKAYDIRTPVFSGSSYASEECLTVRSTFRPRSPLHMILLPSRFLINDNNNAVAAAMYEQDTIRVACLLYIHSTLWSYRQQPFRTDAYIAGIASHAIQNNLDKSGSVEGLSWILIWMALNDRDEGVDDALARTRHVLRLMRVARKLSLETYKSLERHLFDALVGVESRGGDDSASWHSPWLEPDRVWQEVFG